MLKVLSNVIFKIKRVKDFVTTVLCQSTKNVTMEELFKIRLNSRVQRASIFKLKILDKKDATEWKTFFLSELKKELVQKDNLISTE